MIYMAAFSEINLSKFYYINFWFCHVNSVTLTFLICVLFFIKTVHFSFKFQFFCFIAPAIDGTLLCWNDLAKTEIQTPWEQQIVEKDGRTELKEACCFSFYFFPILDFSFSFSFCLHSSCLGKVAYPDRLLSQLAVRLAKVIRLLSPNHYRTKMLWNVAYQAACHCTRSNDNDVRI